MMKKLIGSSIQIRELVAQSRCSERPQILALWRKPLIIGINLLCLFGFNFDITNARVNANRERVLIAISSGYLWTTNGVAGNPSFRKSRAHTANRERPVRLNSQSLLQLVVERQPIDRPGTLGRNHLRGVVRIKILIDKSGQVAYARGISGHPLAIASSASSIRRWKFRPYIVNGKPKYVDGVMALAYDFTKPSPAVIANSKCGLKQVSGKIASPDLCAPPRRVVDDGASLGPNVIELRVLVDENGRVESIQFVSGSPSLFEAAVKSVHQMKFTPKKLGSRAVKTESIIRLVMPDGSAPR